MAKHLDLYFENQTGAISFFTQWWSNLSETDYVSISVENA